MRVAYHLTIPPSPWAACDAVVQEATALHARFGGLVHHLYPGRTPGTRLPRLLWGMGRLPSLWRMEHHVALHHIYNPDPYPFAVLHWLRRPAIYTISAGVQPGDRQNAQKLARLVRTLVVVTHPEQERLRDWGIKNVTVIRPGMDVARFSIAPLPPNLPPTLLMGSAPWTRAQFQTKGVDALLALAQHWPDLHLIFLWRGLLYDEMQARVCALGLADRVEIINAQVDVNAVLARVHAAIVLVTEEALIKAYPHSLLEALAAGRPIIATARIPLALESQAAGCGVALETHTESALRVAIQTVLDTYPMYAKRARDLSTTFSQTQFLEQYTSIYRDAVNLPGS